MCLKAGVPRQLGGCDGIRRGSLLLGWIVLPLHPINLSESVGIQISLGIMDKLKGMASKATGSSGGSSSTGSSGGSGAGPEDKYIDKGTSVLPPLDS